MRRRTLHLTVALVLGLLAACGGGDDDGAGDGTGAPEDGGDGLAALCPLDALEGATKPVEVVFWHNQAGENEALLGELTAEFNASQDAVRVELVAQTGYVDTLTKYKAGLTSGDLPDLVQMEETTVQTLVDSQSTVPLQACVEADDYDVSDFLPRALAYYTTQDVLRSMPWHVSNVVLYYNRRAFEAASLDPDRPPTTLAEVREASEAIVASGAAESGIALRPLGYLNEFWYAKAGQPYVDNGNGRDARATQALLDNETGLELWTWWREMVDDGLAITTSADPESADHLFAIGGGQAAMTVEASSILGRILAVLGTGQFPDVEMGVAPLPGLEPGGGVPVGDGSLWLPDRGLPERVAAAWEYVKFLSAPEQQVRWHLGTGAVPTRRSVADDPGVQAFWAEQPGFRVGFDQLETGPVDEATVGAVIGDYQGVRDAVRDGLTAMLTQGVTPAAALAQAQEDADAAIEEYNRRLG
ncbi:MAG: ABC transporter substrate-binding protein [Acidimicrobiia bacterium]|nr:ABC transporter substrate-binding protein [Acidimicrobiia bacterium]